ncbi:MAG: hypothetical protein AABW80_05580 [Nanoarchaeota archaeon]
MDLKKKLVIGALGLATLTGTFMGNGGGLPPLYTRKTGNSYGINLGVATEFSKGAKHYGLNLSLASALDGGIINGANISILTGPGGFGKEERACEKGNVNGLQLDIVSFPSKEYINGLEVNGLEVNGLQIGLVNNCGSGRNVQVGVYNSNGYGEHIRRGIGFNQSLDR